MHTIRSLVLISVAATSLAAQSTTFPLDPRATYQRTNNDLPLPPLVVDLAALPAPPGTWLRVGTVGAYRHINGGTDTTSSLCGVFSNGSQVLASNLQHRVPGAVAGGPAFIGGTTYYGALPMDIPEDFYISRMTWSDSVIVEVPAGATHLLLGTNDSWYQDNADPNNDFAAVVTVLGTPPLPGTGEHVELRTGVAGTATVVPADKPAPGGSLLTVELAPPIGLIDGSLYLIAANVMPTGSPVPELLPRVRVGPGTVVVQLGIVPPTAGWAATWSMTAPQGFAGTTLLVQGGALATLARNGFYETTIAHRFLLQ